MLGSEPPAPMAPMTGMLCEAGPARLAVAATVGGVTPWPTACTSGAGADPVLGVKLVVVSESLVVPSTTSCPDAAPTGAARITIAPAAPTAAAQIGRAT